MLFDEQKLILKLEPIILRGRDGDWEHSKRVASWTRTLAEERNDLDILLTASYIHDIGWCDVLPSGKITLEKLLEYEVTANNNSEPFIRKVLLDLKYLPEEIESVVRIVKAVDIRRGDNEDEKIVIDADNLSKLCPEHLKDKFKETEWEKMIVRWDEEFPKRIQTDKGKEIYPKLLSDLKKAILKKF